MTTGDYAIETIYRRERLRQSLDKLKNDYQRLAIVLYLMGYRQHEIAEIYGCSKQNIQQIVAEFKRRNGLYWQETGSA